MGKDSLMPRDKNELEEKRKQRIAEKLAIYGFSPEDSSVLHDALYGQSVEEQVVALSKIFDPLETVVSDGDTTLDEAFSQEFAEGIRMRENQPIKISPIRVISESNKAT